MFSFHLKVMFGQDFVLLKKSNCVEYYQSVYEESLKAIYRDLLVGSSEKHSNISFFKVDVKEGIDPAHYGLDKYGVQGPLANNEKIKGINGKDILETLVEEQLLQGSKFLAACWKYGDNLSGFNENLSDGLSFDDAIRNTFTAKVYKGFGFDKFVVYDFEKNSKGYELLESLFFRDSDDLNLINSKMSLYCSK